MKNPQTIMEPFIKGITSVLWIKQESGNFGREGKQMADKQEWGH